MKATADLAFPTGIVNYYSTRWSPLTAFYQDTRFANSIKNNWNACRLIGVRVKLGYLSCTTGGKTTWSFDNNAVMFHAWDRMVPY